jgi:ketosteroid isomerase-like protein
MRLGGSTNHVASPCEIVTGYYGRFDEQAAVDELCAVFADDVVYVRPERVLHGCAEVAAHLASAPPVVNGRHELLRVVADGGTVVVEGRFTGRLGDRALELPFAEVWDVDDAGRVTRRAAYFDTALLS